MAFIIIHGNIKILINAEHQLNIGPWPNPVHGKKLFYKLKAKFIILSQSNVKWERKLSKMVV